MLRKTTILSLVALTAALAAGATYVHAQGPREGRGEFAGPPGGEWGGRRIARAGVAAMFWQADRDGDGAVSRAEFAEAAQARFEGADADRDGIVTKAEIEAAMAQFVRGGADRLFARFDADSDGRVTRAEMDAAVERGLRMRERHGGWQMPEPMVRWRAQRRFDRIDADRDGVVTRAELDSSIAERAGKRAERLLRRGDADRDGRVSRAEFDLAMTARFDRLDRDGDGRILPRDVRGMRGHRGGPDRGAPGERPGGPAERL